MRRWTGFVRWRRRLSGRTVSMRSPSAGSGVSRPLVELVPSRVGSSGPDMVELAAGYDLILDPWQEQVLDGAGGERRDGKHAARDVGVVVPRQNGKDEILI